MASEREEFYDREIAPALLAIARKCEDHGMSMVAKVEWAPGDTGITAILRENASVSMLLAHWGAAAQGNVEQLSKALAQLRASRVHGEPAPTNKEG